VQLIGVKGRLMSETSSSLTIRSVGRVERGGEVSRWIEIEERFKRKAGKDVVQVWKLLVPEKHLGMGANPLEHVVSAWYSMSEDTAPVHVENQQEIRIHLRQLFFGPNDEVTKLDGKSLEINSESLACSGRAATRSEKSGADGAQLFYETWSNSRFPNLAVRQRCDIRIQDKGRPELKKEWQFIYVDSGKDATTALPDAND
jgi:hypothetical protein